MIAVIKKDHYTFSDITASRISLLPCSVFYFSTHFEIVTKFLQLLCFFMILLSSDNVNIFVTYFYILLYFIFSLVIIASKML